MNIDDLFDDLNQFKKKLNRLKGILNRFGGILTNISRIFVCLTNENYKKIAPNRGLGTHYLVLI